MAGAVKKSTIYMREDLHKAVRLKSADTGETVSDIIEEAVEALLADDHHDIQLAKKRKSGPFISYEQLLKNLKKDGVI